MQSKEYIREYQKKYHSEHRKILRAKAILYEQKMENKVKKAEYHKNWKSKFSIEKREEYKKKVRDRRKQFKLQVIQGYGGKCECCGESHFEFMTIDHINGGGQKHRKSLGTDVMCLYKWLIDNNFPKGFRLLCLNCNISLGVYGYCPHKREYTSSLK